MNTNNTILIIAAHGSRNKASAKQVAALCQKVENKNISHTPKFDRVVHGFLQFSDPSLEGVIDQQAEQGAKKIVVFPFFIAAGSHILEDIPELVEKAGKKYPGIEFSITPHLGVMDSIEDLILEEVSSHIAG